VWRGIDTPAMALSVPRMRGRKESQVTMLSLVTPDLRVPKNHPLPCFASRS